MELKLYIPGIKKLQHINSLMLNAPHGKFIMDNIFSNANDFYSVQILPQLYYSVLESLNFNPDRIKISKALKDTIIKEVCYGFEENNFDVMYSVADDIVTHNHGEDSVFIEDTKMLNDVQKQFDIIMDQYNQWDNYHGRSLLQHCVSELIDMSDDYVLYPLIDKVTRINCSVPYEIQVQITQPQMLDVTW